MKRQVLFFGMFDPAYGRNRVLQLGFERNGWEVAECRVNPREQRGLKKYLHLARLGWAQRGGGHDLVIVNFPGQSVVWLARLLFGKKIVFDAFLSLFDSNVFDRKVYGSNSLRGRRDFFLDWLSCRLASRVLLETNAHIEYFVNTFGLPREKFIRIWISADDTAFHHLEAQEEQVFTVHFHGTFIPLQGISYIVEAAALLGGEDIRFRLIGAGQEHDAIQRLVRELHLEHMIEFTGKIPVNEIPSYMARAQIVLGIFGDTQKARRVIPNKVYEAMAMGKAIITADTPAVRELGGASDALSLVPVADPTALAVAIRALKERPELRQDFGRVALALFDSSLRPEHLVRDLLTALRF